MSRKPIGYQTTKHDPVTPEISSKDTLIAIAKILSEKTRDQSDDDYVDDAKKKRILENTSVNLIRLIAAGGELTDAAYIDFYHEIIVSIQLTYNRYINKARQDV